MSFQFTRRNFLAKLPGAAALPYVATTWPGLAAARKITWPEYGDLIVVDFLASPGPFNSEEPWDDLSAEMLNSVKESGITAINLTVSAGADLEQCFREIAKWEKLIDRHSGLLVKIKTVQDITQAKKENKLGIIYGFQNAAMFGTDLTRVEMFRSLGVGVVQLTYNRRNLVGDGCLEPDNAGLSKLGFELVEELDAQNVIVDLSHCSQKTTADGIAASKNPVTISHSGCKAIYNNPRSKDDAELKAMADKGGVLGVYLVPFLVKEGTPPTANDVIKHIEHAINVCGEDHVGIGSDLSINPHNITDEYKQIHRDFILMRRKAGIAAPGEDPDVYFYVEELNSPKRMEMVADLLLANGHSSERVEKIIGGNFMRLMKDVWGG